MRTAELLCEAEKCASLPEVEETLALLGVSMSAVEETIADRPNPESKPAVESKFIELNREIFELIKHQRNIGKLMKKLDAEIHRIQPYVHEFERAAILPAAVIYFVHLIETANQYFDYKLHAEQNFIFQKKGLPNIDEIRRTLLQDDGGLRPQFNCIKERNVYDVAKAICRELSCKHFQHPVPTVPPEDQPARHNWIFRLVSSARRGDYVMDRDPEVELKKMMKNESSVYDRYFLLEPLPAEYNDVSKREAYKKYSELVHSITTMGKEALEEKQVLMSTSSNAIDTKSKRKRDQASCEE